MHYVTLWRVGEGVCGEEYQLHDRFETLQGGVGVLKIGQISVT